MYFGGMSKSTLPHKMLRRAEVQERCALSRAGIYKLMAAGKFPRPVQVTARAVRWHSDEIEAWLTSRPRASGQAAA